MEKQNCKKLNHKHRNQRPSIRERFIRSMVCIGLCEINKIPPPQIDLGHPQGVFPGLGTFVCMGLVDFRQVAGVWGTCECVHVIAGEILRRSLFLTPSEL